MSPHRVLDLSWTGHYTQQIKLKIKCRDKGQYILSLVEVIGSQVDRSSSSPPPFKLLCLTLVKYQYIFLSWQIKLTKSFNSPRLQKYNSWKILKPPGSELLTKKSRANVFVWHQDEHWCQSAGFFALSSSSITTSWSCSPNTSSTTSSNSSCSC